MVCRKWKTHKPHSWPHSWQWMWTFKRLANSWRTSGKEGRIRGDRISHWRRPAINIKKWQMFSSHWNTTIFSPWGLQTRMFQKAVPLFEICYKFRPLSYIKYVHEYSNLTHVLLTLMTFAYSHRLTALRAASFRKHHANASCAFMPNGAI